MLCTYLTTQTQYSHTLYTNSPTAAPLHLLTHTVHHCRICFRTHTPTHSHPPTHPHPTHCCRLHPEAGYSLRNSPHLRPAWELDEAILRVSHAITTGAVPGINADMKDERAVRSIIFSNIIINADMKDELAVCSGIYLIIHTYTLMLLLHSSITVILS